VTADLVAFLRARLDEDGAVAREAGAAPWRHNPRVRWQRPNDDCFEEVVSAGGHGAAVRIASTGEHGDPVSKGRAQHIARWDPARVLAEVDAKRRILALHHATPSPADGPADPPVTVCVECGPDTHTLWETDPRGARGDWYPCPTLRLLVLPYRDHPDYQPAWVPETEG